MLLGQAGCESGKCWESEQSSGHVCVKVHVSVNVCCVNTGAYGGTHLQSPDSSKRTDSFSKASVYSYCGPHAELKGWGWQASNSP